MPSRLDLLREKSHQNLYSRVARLITVATVLAVVGAAVTAGQSRHRVGPEVRTLVEDGGRMAWSAQGDVLAFDKPDPGRDDGLFDIYILDQPLSSDSRSARCLTCTAPDLRKMHAINPAFEPAGDFIVFQTVGLAKKTGITAVDLATPTRSNRSELWLARADGKDFWQLTKFLDLGAAGLDPTFSYEGDRLVWSERFNTRNGQWGAWRLRSGAIKVKRGVPKLVALRTEFSPEQPALIIPHGYSLNDRGFLFSANLEEGQSERGLDIYQLGGTGEKSGTKAGDVIRLTRTGGVAELTARYHPEGHQVTFSSSQTLQRAESAKGLPVSELWTTSVEGDGTDAKRLTFFNETPAAEYRGPTFVGDFEWHPGGEWLAVQTVSGPTSSNPETRITILLLRWPAPD